MSASTIRGWWKAPTRFLPSERLIPVLPPTELSTWASRLVGTCTKGRPGSGAGGAQRDGGREAGQVADHAAAERHHRGAAVGLGAQHLLQHRLQHGEILAGL